MDSAACAWVESTAPSPLPWQASSFTSSEEHHFSLLSFNLSPSAAVFGLGFSLRASWVPVSLRAPGKSQLSHWRATALCNPCLLFVHPPLIWVGFEGRGRVSSTIHLCLQSPGHHLRLEPFSSLAALQTYLSSSTIVCLIKSLPLCLVALCSHQPLQAMGTKPAQHLGGEAPQARQAEGSVTVASVAVCGRCCLSQT